MRPERRLSQAISEGDGISLLAAVDDAAAARTAVAAGADGLVVSGADIAAIRGASELPILSTTDPVDAPAGADACVLGVDGLEDDDAHVERRFAQATDAGVECVVCVADEDELRLALERLDPEILLLSARRAREDDALEHVLGLLPDVPAGKLAIAELTVLEGDEVAVLERAGVDAVVVRAEDVARFAGDLQSQHERRP